MFIILFFIKTEVSNSQRQREILVADESAILFTPDYNCTNGSAGNTELRALLLEQEIGFQEICYKRYITEDSGLIIDKGTKAYNRESYPAQIVPYNIKYSDLKKSYYK